jgi:hypothetical protein
MFTQRCSVEKFETLAVSKVVFRGKNEAREAMIASAICLSSSARPRAL